MTVTLRGVLHAVVKLRWEGDDAGSRSCEADWACIYSLKEDRPPYLPSRFSLFQSLTNEAMDILDRCRRLRVDGDERTASVEELLIRLCHSEMPEPLPALICLTFGSFHRLASDVLVQSLLVRLTGKLIKCCVDGLKRTFHRVRCSRPVDYQGARYSIGFFDRARRDAVIQGPAVAYPPITGGELIAHAMQRKLEAAQAKAKGKAYEVSQTKRHATRVAAVTTELLQAGHEVTVVTNAPEIPFASVLPPSALPAAARDVANPGPSTAPLKRYATYRRKKVDAGIVQPKAYDVDRRATYEVLKRFLDEREETLREEVAWLKEAGMDAVLSDATFLGCVAAARAGIPAIIISNFTFDSCYSYLSHPSLHSSTSAEAPEPPLDPAILDPLVHQTIADYACASLLLRLPGVIPLPAFDSDVPMPSGRWVSEDRTTFVPEIEGILSRPTSTVPSAQQGRKVVDVPLIVRPPSTNANTPEFRRELLSSMGVPDYLLDSKVLLVSFGGQAIPRPRSRPPSPLSSPIRRSISASSSLSLDVPRDERREAGLLPKGWIAIVTGLSGGDNAIRDDLPYGIFASEKDVYVPDLTWVADCVLGKLGYGTCSETLSCRTPFIYVPRPLFVEEFGLKRLMQARGVSLELDRADFEAGRWEFHIEEAYEQGRADKEEARRTGFVDERAGKVIRREIEAFMEQWKAE
ncbi:L-arabinokinase [Rhodotorula toruloides]|uniref:L-arabinokinase n=1 Tax=Rhodotorula toruloides TaxID=5286 RepID=A0A511KPS9_RHOTO|nr:L-arabinokinase [Rhodotorula toruloides]